MKVALFQHTHFDTPRIGLVVDDRVNDITEWVGTSRGCLISTFFDRLQKDPDPAVERTLSLSEVRLLPPALGAQSIVCVGVNYADHAKLVAERTGTEYQPDGPPALFLKVWSSLVGPDEPLLRPAVSDWFDFEAELAVVIGKECRNVAVEDALEMVGGYTLGIDGSVRDWQRNLPTPTAGKNFEASGSLGPWLVTADEIPDPSRLRITADLNGTIMQDGELSQLLNDVPALIAHVSSFIRLQPGDVIFTGTPAGSFADRGNDTWLVPGDRLTVTIPEIGSLCHEVVDEIR